MAVKKHKGKKANKVGKKKKGKKGKKKVIKKAVLPPPPPPPTPPPPPPPTYAKIFEYTFGDGISFLDSLKDIDFTKPSYVLFIPIEESLCKTPKDSLSLEEALYLHLIRMQKEPLSKDIQFIIVNVERKTLAESPLHHHPEILLKEVPSLMRWGNLRKIVGAEECYDPKMLEFFFEDETNRNSRTIEETSDRCPFLPPPPPPPPPPVVPEPPPDKKPVKKKKSKGKGKKGKKNKGKGMKSKGKGTKGKKKK